MSPDYKFGWHILWIIPLFLIMNLIQSIRHFIEQSIHRRKIKNILKDPEIAKLSELAGIKKGNNE